ncbi:hypothetical protein O3M35_006303 [Rhynocoris fuscipes]|uniref:Uncharacterized protein n=1 Tax=Rhynocoris fuscipes TaxID=488301 RepID=A0AAW1DIS7_9HEMI
MLVSKALCLTQFSLGNILALLKLFSDCREELLELLRDLDTVIIVNSTLLNLEFYFFQGFSRGKKCLVYAKQNRDQFGHKDFNYSIRYKDHFPVSFTGLNKTRYSINYWMPKLFNALPAFSCQGLPEKSFVARINKFLVKKVFYDITDFLIDNFENL